MYNNFERIQYDQESIVKITNLPQNTFCEYFCSLHRFFRNSSGKQMYIVKAFPSTKASQYKKEKELLELLEHPNILKPLISNHFIFEQLANQFKGDVLVFHASKYGDLMGYINRFGGFTQEITKFYLKRIVRALIYAEHQTGFSHPNLTTDNILVKDNRDIVLCGWSNSLQTGRQQPGIEIAKLAIQFVTGRNPFTNKDIKKSPFYKFINASRINKFWDQIQRSTGSRYKNFSFSMGFKHSITQMLLGRLKTYEQIEAFCLNQEQMSLQEVTIQLQNHERMLADHKQMLFNKS